MRSPLVIAAELGALLADQPGELALLRELLSSDVLGRSLDASSDTVLEARRAADRARKKAERIQRNTAKQTMGGGAGEVQGTSEDASKDKGLSACNLLTDLSSSEPQGRKKVVAEKARARGIRLDKDSTLSTVNRYFAAAEGVPEAEIDRVWSEFIDYWIAVPGQRGTKTNWDATWRNRVRALTPWKAKSNGHSGFAPRPGSKEDNREKTHAAIQELRGYIDAHADDARGGGDPGRSNAGLLPFAKPA